MYELVRDYRPSDEIIDALKAITKEPDETYIHFILRIKQNKIATHVKIEDLRHNLSDLGKGNLREKYLMALYILNDSMYFLSNIDDIWDEDDNEL